MADGNGQQQGGEGGQGGQGGQGGAAPGGVLIDFAKAGAGGEVGPGSSAGEVGKEGGGAAGGEGGGEDAGGTPALRDLPAELFLDLPEGQDWGKLVAAPFLKDGKLDLRALLKSNADAKTELRNRASRAPASYEVRVPEALAKAGYGVPEDDALWTGVAGWAKKHGLAQGDLDELQGMYFEAVAGGIPDHDAEMRTLKTAFGERTDATLTAIAQWAGGIVQDEAQRGALAKLALTADGVLALDALRKAGRERTLPGTGDGGGADALSEDELRKLQASKEYLDGDAATHRRVAEGYKRIAEAKGRRK